jgi:DNA primase catalytic core
MARFSEEELDDIRRNNDIVTLIEGYGTKFKERPTPNEYVGCCPLHDDETPSLFVNRAKGVWQCKGACGCGGDCFRWVMKAEKVSFVGSVELLKAKAVGRIAGKGTKAAYVPRLENPMTSTAEDHELLFQVAEFYHSQLKENKAAMEYLASRGLDNAEAITKFKIGVSDRSLGRRIPKKQVKAGREQRARLEALGVMKEATGHEAMRGCITFPVLLSENRVGEIYGRRYTRAPKNQSHWYLSGPHVGVWNAEAFGASKEIILCESIIDALTFWIAGFRNVTCSYGNQGFTEELFQAFIKSGVEICWIAWDNDDKSNPLALQLAERLMTQGIKCMRIVYPGNIKDANEFAMKVKDGNGTAHGSLSMLMRNAEWLLPTNIDVTKRYVPKSVDPLSSIDSVSTDSAPEAQHQQQPAPKEESQPVTSATEPVTIPIQVIVDAPKELSSLGAKTVEVATPTEPNQITAPVKQPSASLEVEIKDNEIIIPIGNRSYRIRGLARNTNGFDSMKVNVLARKGEAFFVDTLDIYAARGRNAFIKEASRELALEEEIIKRDLGKVLLKLEEIQDSQALENVAKHKQPEMTDGEKHAALQLLKSDRLIERILEDFELCGVVGEQTNKLFGYIAVTSRKLDRPLAVMVQSSSAAGKSSLMEAVLGLVPPEEQIIYSAMTGQSLFYMGETNLKNKILAISEEEGIRQAAYALKILQSEGELNIASTGKDPGTGRMETQNYHVEGPVMIFLTTTSIDVDIELANRCTVLTVNEEREQTDAIYKQQRRDETWEGLQANLRRANVRKLHHNAQRLIRPLDVVNPYAEELRFMDSQTRFRRDHKKYLTLIRSIALLHQYQREIFVREIEGQRREVIEVTADDIALANRLADAALGKSIDDLPGQSRRLLRQLFDMVATEAEEKAILASEVRFTRRQIREKLGWSATPLAIHLDRLHEMEYILAHGGGRGKTIQYELFYDGRGREGQPTLCGLIDPSNLRPRSTFTMGELAGQTPGLTSFKPDITTPHHDLTGQVAVVDVGSEKATTTYDANLTSPSAQLPSSKPSQNPGLPEAPQASSPNETQHEVEKETEM